MQTILVTGGAGYIGSHTVLELLDTGYQVVVLDNLERGYLEALNRVKALTNRELSFVQADLRDKDQLASVFTTHQINAVIHFAAYKDVGEADRDPQKFYNNNILGTKNLLDTMRDNQVKQLVFSSTSAVYGNSEQLPMTEDLPVAPLNAYGHTKAAIEWMLTDYSHSYQLNAVSLRYFNAAGAHPSGQIGEDPSHTGNVLPMITQTLVGRRKQFLLFGDQFATPDGTQQRDYIHVMDLATGHIAALNKLQTDQGYFIYNLGTGQPSSVKQLINLAQQISGRQLNYTVADPRPGDPLTVYCDPQQANKDLNWTAQYDIEAIISHQWNWATNNPNGYS
jgi:UDP-glucose 4-epimerase